MDDVEMAVIMAVALLVSLACILDARWRQKVSLLESLAHGAVGFVSIFFLLLAYEALQWITKTFLTYVGVENQTTAWDWMIILGGVVITTWILEKCNQYPRWANKLLGVTVVGVLWFAYRGVLYTFVVI